MKKIMYPLFFLMIYMNERSNSQSIFQKSYGLNTTVGYSLQTDDTGCLIAGTTSASGQGRKDILLIKTDLDGALIWSETIGGSGDEIAHSIKKTSDGGYIIVGSTSSYVSASTDSSNVYIVKINNSGSVQWTRAIGSFNAESGSDVIETYDHKYAIVGFTKSMGPGNEDVYFLELNSTGSLLWSYGMGSTGSDFGNSLAQLLDHGFYIVGSTTGFGAGGEVPLLIKTDETGIVVNPSYTFDLFTIVNPKKRYFTKIINGYSNDYLITGSDGLGSIGDAQHFVVDFGQFNTFYWWKDYTLNSGEGVATSIDKAPNGEFIIGGTMGFDHPALIKIDAAGHLLSNKFYPDINSPYYGKGLDVKSTPDGGFVLLGYRYSTTDTSVYLIKADSNLSSGCDEHDGFSNQVTDVVASTLNQTVTSATGTNYIANDSGIVNLASPSTNVICFISGIGQDILQEEILKIVESKSSIDFLLQDKGDYIRELKIYNAIGDEIKSIENPSQSVSILGFAKGIYFYQVLTNKSKRFDGKFIVL